MELYADSGFRGTGLTAIGERAGVTHAAVLYHYGTAKNLLLAVLDERDRRQEPHFRKVFDRGGLDALRNLAEIARINERSPGYAKLFTVLEVESFDGDADVREYFVKRSRRLRRYFVRILRAGQEAGEIRKDVDVAVKANEILSFIEGAQLLRFLDPTRSRLVDVYEEYSLALVRDLSLS